MILISPTQMKTDMRYAFAVGKIRALETRLLNNQQAARLIDAKGAQGVLSELANHPDYEPHLGLLSNPSDYEIMLQAELERVNKLISAIDPDKQITDLLRIRHDFYNCKVISKANFLDEDPAPAESNLGLYPVKEWEHIIVDGYCDNKNIPQKLREYICRTQEKAAAEDDLRLRDIIWDQALFSYLWERAVKLDNFFVLKWLKLRIDTLNFSTLLRCKAQGADKKILERALIDNGEINKGLFIDSFETAFDELPQKFSTTPYYDIINEGISAYKRDKSLSYWEKSADDLEISFLQQSRLMSIGVEPLFSYLLAKENEARVLRVIMVGKINKLDKGKIGKRMRKLYA